VITKFLLLQKLISASSQLKGTMSHLLRIFAITIYYEVRDLTNIIYDQLYQVRRFPPAQSFNSPDAFWSPNCVSHDPAP
jgi:hypothetical protein